MEKVQKWEPADNRKEFKYPKEGKINTISPEKMKNKLIKAFKDGLRDSLPLNK